MGTEAGTPRRKAARRRVDGNHLLYHFLQKTLLESDAEQFRSLSAHLVNALGVWLSPRVYQQFPFLVPFAVRDPLSRGSKARGIPDQWGSPDERCLFRDDNSLIKNLPQSLAIENPSNRLLHNRYIGTSFVASHVWRELAPSGAAPREPETYSFVPNVVWLPSQVSKLSDREGSFVQTYLQAVAVSIYGSLPLTPALSAIVEPIWERLPIRPAGVQGTSLPDPHQLNYFRFDEDWLARRLRAVDTVTRALSEVREGRPLTGKVISTRYTEGLAGLPNEAAEKLHTELARYSHAVREAASTALSGPAARSAPE
jgi:hypothetical protein